MKTKTAYSLRHHFWDKDDEPQTDILHFDTEVEAIEKAKEIGREGSFSIVLLERNELELCPINNMWEDLNTDTLAEYHDGRITTY